MNHVAVICDFESFTYPEQGREDTLVARKLCIRIVFRQEAAATDERSTVDDIS